MIARIFRFFGDRACSSGRRRIWQSGFSLIFSDRFPSSQRHGNGADQLSCLVAVQAAVEPTLRIDAIFDLAEKGRDKTDPNRRRQEVDGSSLAKG